VLKALLLALQDHRVLRVWAVLVPLVLRVPLALLVMLVEIVIITYSILAQILLYMLETENFG
jgi:hypothetical protein